MLFPRFGSLPVLTKLLRFTVVMVGFWTIGNPGAGLRAQLDGVSEVGHSYQSDGRGGTETAIGDTGLAHVRQPAATVTQPYGKFDSKITSIFIDNQWADWANKTSSSVNYTLAYNLGAIVPLGENFGLGLAYETGGWRTRFANRRNDPRSPNQFTDSFTYSTQAIYANLGMKVTDKLYVGAGPHLHATGLGMELNSGQGNLNIPSGQAVGGGYQLGVIYQLTEMVRLGASYGSPTYFSGLHFGEATYFLPGIDPKNGDLSLDSFTIPGRISFGASAAVTENFKVAAEAGYLNYGSSLLGGANLQGLVNERFNLGFQDIWVMNSGLDYDFCEWLSGSVGYVFNTQPINKTMMIPIAASIVQNQFTWGLRFRHGNFWTGFAHIISLPASVDSTSYTHPELGPGYQTSSVRQVIQSFNCGAGFQF